MNEYDNNADMKSALTRSPRPLGMRELSLIDRTRSEIESLETALSKKRELLGLLEKNPETQRVIELMMGGVY